MSRLHTFQALQVISPFGEVLEHDGALTEELGSIIVPVGKIEWIGGMAYNEAHHWMSCSNGHVYKVAGPVLSTIAMPWLKGMAFMDEHFDKFDVIGNGTPIVNEGNPGCYLFSEHIAAFERFEDTATTVLFESGNRCVVEGLPVKFAPRYDASWR